MRQREQDTRPCRSSGVTSAAPSSATRIARPVRNPVGPVINESDPSGLPKLAGSHSDRRAPTSPMRCGQATAGRGGHTPVCGASYSVLSPSMPVLPGWWATSYAPGHRCGCDRAGGAAAQPDAGWPCRDRRPVNGDLGSASPLQAVEKAARRLL